MTPQSFDKIAELVGEAIDEKNASFSDSELKMRR